MAAIFVVVPPHGKRAFVSRFSRSWLMRSALWLYLKYTYALIANRVKDQAFSWSLCAVEKTKMMLCSTLQDGVYSLGWKSSKITQKIVNSFNRWFFPHNFAKNAGDKLPHYTQDLRLLRAEEILLKSQNTFQADFLLLWLEIWPSNLLWSEIWPRISQWCARRSAWAPRLFNCRLQEATMNQRMKTWPGFLFLMAIVAFKGHLVCWCSP